MLALDLNFHFLWGNFCVKYPAIFFMEDSVSSPSPRRNSGTNCAMISSSLSKRHGIASGSKPFAHQPLKRISLLDCGKVGRGAGGQIALFLLKVAALESVRRISKSKCPPVWSGLQALQVVCYPPFKWIQRWNPFGILVKGMQVGASSKI